jgi:hypothetical protein
MMSLVNVGALPYCDRMTKAYDELVEFLAAGSTPASLLEFQPSEETRTRVLALIRKEKDSGLLPEEADELDDYLKLEHLMRLAKARARIRIGRE